MIVLAYLPSALAYSYKGYLCVKASAKTYQLLTTKQEETAITTQLRATTSALTVITQAADIILDLATPPQIRFASKLIVGTVDFAGTCTEKVLQEEDFGLLDVLDMASTFLFRTTDALNISTKIFPKWKKTGKLTNEAFRSAGAITKTVQTYFDSPLNRCTHIPVKFLQDPVFRRYQCPISETPIRFICVVETTKQSIDPVYYERREILQWIKENPQQPPPRWPANVPLTQKQIIPWTEVQTQIDQRLSLLLEQEKISNIYDRHVLEVQSTKNIEEFALIPPLFQEDAVLRYYSCSLSLKPMRFVYVVQGTENNLAPVFYEKTTILKWLNEYPGEKPRRWPDIPVSANHLMPWMPIQTFIDRRFRTLFEQTKQQLRGEQTTATLEAQSPSSQGTTTDDLSQIPNDFLGDEVLRQYLCPLQQKAIRIIVVIKGTEHSSNPIYYENKAIQNWIRDNPDTLPSCWPANIPLSEENLIPWKPIQHIINRQLRELIDYHRSL